MIHERHSNLWLELFPEKYFEGTAAAALNMYRNQRKVRLSEIDINKRNFNYWKNNDLFSDLSFNAQKGWSIFNGIDEIALLTVGELWKFGFGIDYIKPVLNFLYDDSLVKKDIEIYLSSNKVVDIEEIFNPEQPNLLSFFLRERNVVKHYLNNLEYLMLITGRLNKNVSLIMDSNANVNVLIGENSISIIGNKSLFEFFNGTSINLSLSKFHINIYQQNLELREDVMMNIFKKSIYRDDKDYVHEDLPTDINISSAIKEHQNQDIKIEIRNKQKVKISRTIISSKNK
jgi:hypothetical protein